jgi:hypothetical protein
MNRQADLTHMRNASRFPNRFARRLNRRQKEAEQNSDDRDHDEKLDQRKTAEQTAFVPALPTALAKVSQDTPPTVVGVSCETVERTKRTAPPQTKIAPRFDFHRFAPSSLLRLDKAKKRPTRRKTFVFGALAA